MVTLTDLEAQLLAVLQAVLQAVREQTKHAPGCNSIDEHGVPYDGSDIGFVHGFACTCDWQARVEAEVARRWAASLAAASVGEQTEPTTEGCYRAALSAAQRGTI